MTARGDHGYENNGLPPLQRLGSQGLVDIAVYDHAVGSEGASKARGGRYGDVRLFGSISSHGVILTVICCPTRVLTGRLIVRAPASHS